MTEAFYNHLAKTRHQIHQHPEVSEEEHETTVFLKGYLKNLGIEPLNYSLKTGLIAEIGSGHPIIALRADIDALPIKERQDFLMPATMGPCMLVVMIFTRPLFSELLRF